MFWLRVNMKRIWNRIKECLKDESGIGVVEIILILVVELALNMGMWFKCPVLQGFRNDIHIKHRGKVGQYFPESTPEMH